ncbi:hypothetical protein BB560_001055 [Smittium megazygosporum]|uniref:Uncharacterized protein n=1 Tax=Smittium megazygosporum TaxID=133381 RepID=A0A2T9ZIL1_9FUNG|nr:hypothetical protein BB560_001055 [Smittium megazygosporum]
MISSKSTNLSSDPHTEPSSLDAVQNLHATLLSSISKQQSDLSSIKHTDNLTDALLKSSSFNLLSDTNSAQTDISLSPSKPESISYLLKKDTGDYLQKSLEENLESLILQLYSSDPNDPSLTSLFQSILNQNKFNNNANNKPSSASTLNSSVLPLPRLHSSPHSLSNPSDPSLNTQVPCESNPSHRSPSLFPPLSDTVYNEIQPTVSTEAHILPPQHQSVNPPSHTSHTSHISPSLFPLQDNLSKSSFVPNLSSTHTLPPTVNYSPFHNSNKLSSLPHHSNNHTHTPQLNCNSIPLVPNYLVPNNCSYPDTFQHNHLNFLSNSNVNIFSNQNTSYFPLKKSNTKPISTGFLDQNALHFGKPQDSTAQSILPAIDPVNRNRVTISHSSVSKLTSFNPINANSSSLPSTLYHHQPLLDNRPEFNTSVTHTDIEHPHLFNRNPNTNHALINISPIPLNFENKVANNVKHNGYHTKFLPPNFISNPDFNFHSGQSQNSHFIIKKNTVAQIFSDTDSSAVNEFQIPKTQSSPPPSSFDLTPPQSPTLINPNFSVNEKWLSSNNLKKLRQTKGVEYLKGRFTRIENEKINAAISEVCRSKGWSRKTMEQFLFQKNPNDQEEYSGVWKQICKSIPNRPLQAIYHHIKRSFNPKNYQGSWTKEQDKKLAFWVERLGPRWEIIGRGIGRTGTNCRDRWRNIKQGDNRQVGRWTQEEKINLEKAVAGARKEAGIVPFEIEFGEEIGVSWERVAEIVKTRNASQCRGKWFKFT